MKNILHGLMPWVSTSMASDTSITTDPICRRSRLLTPLKMSYEAAKKRTKPYNKIVGGAPGDAADALALIRKATGEARRSEGNALLTVQALTANLSLLLWKSRFLPTNGQTIDRVEASIKRLADFDRTVEKSARELALERLDRLPIVPAY